MWIISKKCGLFNADEYKRFFKTNEGFVCTDDGRIVSTDADVFDKIIEAIKNNKPYVEVD